MSKNINYIILTGLLVSLSIQLNAQTHGIRFQRIGLEDGLSNMTVDALHQDRFGFIWVGTWDGVSRYDGQSFEVYRTIPGDTNSLISNEIKSFAEPNDSSLWVSTYGGLTRWDHKQSRFFKRQPNGHLLPQHYRLSHHLVADQHGRMFLGGHQGNDILRISGDSISESIKVHGAGPFNRTPPVILATESGTWIGDSFGLMYLKEGETEAKAGESYDPLLLTFNNKHISALIQDQHGVIWIGAEDGLWGYSPETGALEEILLPGSFAFASVQALTIGDDGQLWIGTAQGLHCRYPLSNLVDSYYHDPNDPFSLSHDNIHALLVDRGGTLWVGTARGGLNHAYLRKPSTFNTVTHSAFGLPRHELVVFSFEQASPDKMWVGTNHGLFLLDKASKQILRQWKADVQSSHSLLGETVMAIHQAEDGKLILSTRPGGLQELDIATGRITPLPIYQSDDQKSIGFFRRILPSTYDADTLFLAGNLGTGRYIRSTGEWKNFLSSYSWDLTRLGDCQFLIGENGLSTYNMCEDRTEVHSWVATTQDQKKANTALYQDDAGLWIGTYGMGLIQKTLDNPGYRRWSRQHGLPSDYVFGIQEDNRGQLWLSTTEGLVRFNKETEAVLTFGQDDGLMDNEFGTNSSFKASDGEMYFGGNNGFVAFYPDQVEVRQSRYNPPLVITSLRLSGDPLPVDSAVWMKHQISFPGYLQQHLEIGFAALDYSRPANLSYQFRLLGWDDEWTQPSPRANAQFTNLKPGTYQFEVRSTNGDGKWTSKTRRLTVIISPLWYQRWWIRVVVPFSGLALVLGSVFIRFRRSRAREREILYHRMASIQQQALSAQMDHHFTFNALNSIQRFITDNDKASSLYYISKFGKLIRRFLDQARKNEHPIEEEITTLELYLSLESLRAKHSFTYRFEVDQDLDPFNTDIPTSLLQPLVENAIWHGLVPRNDGGGLLLIRFELQERNLVLTVEDNGVGKKHQKSTRKKHESKGMLIIRERLETLETLTGQSLPLEFEASNPGDKFPGTKVSIYLPHPDH